MYVFHEAADIRIFVPREADKEHDVVWIGNWGDDERSEQIRDYLIGTRQESADADASRSHGVRYPTRVRQSFDKAGIHYEGWVPNFAVPEVFANARMTLHILRSFYCSRPAGHPDDPPLRGDGLRHSPRHDDVADTEHLFCAGPRIT